MYIQNEQNSQAGQDSRKVCTQHELIVDEFLFLFSVIIIIMQFLTCHVSASLNDEAIPHPRAGKLRFCRKSF